MNKHPDMRGKSLLTLHDLSASQLARLLALAGRLKKKKQSGAHGSLLKGKHVAMVFEKASTRTRCAVAVAVADEGGSAEYLSSDDIHLGKKESAADTARVLGRMFDGILFRGYKQETVETLAEHAGVPVWNGLTDESHPTQALADLMTIKERFNKFRGLKVVYMGDGRNNVARSLMTGCAMVGADFVDCVPPKLAPPPEILEKNRRIARLHGGSVGIEYDPLRAAKGANAVYTDVWASMGEESRFAERVRLLRPYQVNMKVMRATGNLESGSVIFLHCLPAFHDNNTDLTKKMGALEVSDDVFNASFSKVFDQAENRVHTIKALLVATLT